MLLQHGWCITGSPRALKIIQAISNGHGQKGYNTLYVMAGALLVLQQLLKSSKQYRMDTDKRVIILSVLHDGWCITGCQTVLKIIQAI